MYDKLITTDDLTQVVEKVQQLRTSDKQAAEQAATALSNGKADKATTLSGYGITDAYTKTEIDSTVQGINGDIQSLSSGKADKATSLSGYGITDAYTKTETDERIQAVVGSAPEALDTLGEIASKLADSDDVVSGIVNTLSTKSDKSTTVTNVSYASKKLQKTVNGVTSDVVSIGTIKTDLALTKSDVGLNNVNNTSDADKPISTLTQTALDGKVDKTITVNGHALSSNVTVSKSDVGLGNVDNTSDVDKPISSATQTALNAISNKIENAATFGGLEIAPGPLYYDGSDYIIKDHWRYNSYDDGIYGVQSGSTYFNFIELGKVFDSEGNSFSTNSGSIDNINTIDGWRVPTIEEFEIIFSTGSTLRTGSIVNNRKNSHYAHIKLGDTSEYDVWNKVYGILVFPDNRVITGKTLTGVDNTNVTINFTQDELAEYISQGCAFIPTFGYSAPSFEGFGEDIVLWTASDIRDSSNNTVNNLHCIYHSTTGFINFDDQSNKSLWYSQVRCVRNNTAISSKIDRLKSVKVDKIDGKGLSTNDYTDAEKTKLSGIANGAQVNVIETVKVNNTALTPNSLKAINITVPTKVSDLTNDTGFTTTPGMVVLSYGSSTWSDFTTAFASNSVIYCKASSNSNPATGTQSRYAFMAYVSNSSVEFQYYRSISSHSDSQQGDQVFVYTLNSSNTWTVATREAATKITVGSGLTSSYSSGVKTITGKTKLSEFTDDLGTSPTHTHSQYLTAHQDISGKADKVANAVSGDIAKLDANGNLVDGGNTVEYSKNLAIESVSKPNSEFWYRKTGDGITSTNTSGHGRISRIYGKSIIWNQLVQNGNFADNSIWSNVGTTSNGVITVTRTATGSAITQSLAQNMSYANDHKYLFFASLKSNNSSTTINLFPTGTSLDGSTLYNYYSEWTRVSYLWTKTGTDHQLQFRGYNLTDPSVNIDFSVKNVVCFDLTQMFGSGNEPSTAAEFEAMFPEEYYDYNAGEIRSLDFDAIETIGFNQFDGEIGLGNVSSLDGGISSHETNRYSKNFIPIIPNTQYYLYKPSIILVYPRYYDINKNYLTFAELGISDTSTNGNFTTPARAYYMRFVSLASSGNTYPDNPEICINLSDPTRNGTYEPYWKKTNYVKISRDLRQRDLLDDHNYIFPDGLRSAGNVYDEIVGNKAIKRVGKINLGDYSWSAQTAYDHLFNTTIPTMVTSVGSGVSNILCPKYLTVNKTTWANFSTMDQVIMKVGGNTTSKTIGISDSNYSTGSALKTALSGVYCLYELETPVEYDLPQDWRYQIDTCGTERFIDANMPIKADIDYTLIDKVTKSALDENYLSPQIDKEIITTEPITFIGTNFDNNKFQITSEVMNGNAVTLGWRENGSKITFLGTNSLLDQGELSGAIMFDITDGTTHKYLDIFPNGTFNWNNSNVLTAAQISASTNTATWGSNVSLGTIGGTEFKFKMPDCKIAWVTERASSTAGNTASGSYDRTQWVGTVAGLTSLYDGLMIAYKIPVAGCARGTTLNINNLGEHPCLYNTSMLTTHYPVNSTLILVYDQSITCSVYVNNVSTSFTGCWTTFCYDSGNTKNTAGTTNNAGTKLFLAGATEQSANPQTYSNVNVYIGTDNCLYSNGKKVVTQDQLTDIETLLASI